MKNKNRLWAATLAYGSRKNLRKQINVTKTNTLRFVSNVIFVDYLDTR